MWAIIIKIVQWVLGKYNDYVVGANDFDKVQVTAKASVLSAGAFWFQLFFIIPLALWWSSVLLYSIFWCRLCAFPQPWSIAALPPPLDAWAGAIIGFLFLVQTFRKV